MKTRNGFVSNSSSSSFVVSVPQGFTVSLDDLTDSADAWESFSDVDGCVDDDGELTNKAAELVNEELAGLANGKDYHRYSYNSIDVYYVLKTILKENNMVMMELDGPGGDGMDMLIPFYDMREKK